MRKRRGALWLALGLGAAGAMVLNGVRRWGKQNELSCLRLAPTSGEAVSTQIDSAESMCTHRVSMLTQDALNLDAHLPFLQEAAVYTFTSNVLVQQVARQVM